MDKEKKSVFETLYAVDCTKYVKKKNNLSYLSWSYAWGQVMKYYPSSSYKVYENEQGLFYHTDGRTCWVKTGVTIEGVEMIEMLPVMDFRNQAIARDKVTSTDVNKAIQRSLTKACARHGLGLYIYDGEDLPEPVAEERENELVDLAIAEAETCTNRAELAQLWGKYSGIRNNKRFNDAVKAKGKEFK